jgi:hypothetical protein
VSAWSADKTCSKKKKSEKLEKQIKRVHNLGERIGGCANNDEKLFGSVSVATLQIPVGIKKSR